MEEAREVEEKVHRTEGERGYLRGRVGIVIEQLRLVRGVNSLIETHIEDLAEKCGHLKLMRNLMRI